MLETSGSAAFARNCRMCERVYRQAVEAVCSTPARGAWHLICKSRIRGRLVRQPTTDRAPSRAEISGRYPECFNNVPDLSPRELLSYSIANSQCGVAFGSCVPERAAAKVEATFVSICKGSRSLTGHEIQPGWVSTVQPRPMRARRVWLHADLISPLEFNVNLAVFRSHRKRFGHVRLFPSIKQEKIAMV